MNGVVGFDIGFPFPPPRSGTTSTTNTTTTNTTTTAGAAVSNNNNNTGTNASMPEAVNSINYGNGTRHTVSYTGTNNNFNMPSSTVPQVPQTSLNQNTKNNNNMSVSQQSGQTLNQVLNSKLPTQQQQKSSQQQQQHTQVNYVPSNSFHQISGESFVKKRYIFYLLYIPRVLL